MEIEILDPKPESQDKTYQKRLFRVKAAFWKTLKKAARQIPIVEEVVAAYYCALDPRTPIHVKATIIGALAYFVMPLDLIPDFIAMVGFGDDLAVLAAAISQVKKHILPGHREKAIQALAEHRDPDDPEVIRAMKDITVSPVTGSPGV
ncbi:MAG: DUF1232 domain-containing protein [Cohaesibacteraceae bacterium]|nr:DUF1232 domain-containing protein [Cohaesibacteraceae bacterium]MBL4876237.1 DUF1232 domain-containing protein [Cohaesibacteraceae bacterium]